MTRPALPRGSVSPSFSTGPVELELSPSGSKRARPSGFDAGQTPRAIDKLAVKAAGLVVVVTNQLRIQRHDQAVWIVKARVHRLRLAKTLDKETAANEHHQRERDLGHNQSVAQTEPAKPSLGLRFGQSLQHRNDLGI